MCGRLFRLIVMHRACASRATPFQRSIRQVTQVGLAIMAIQFVGANQSVDCGAAFAPANGTKVPKDDMSAATFWACERRTRSFRLS